MNWFIFFYFTFLGAAIGRYLVLFNKGNEKRFFITIVFVCFTSTLILWLSGGIPNSIENIAATMTMFFFTMWTAAYLSYRAEESKRKKQLDACEDWLDNQAARTELNMEEMVSAEAKKYDLGGER